MEFDHAPQSALPNMEDRFEAFERSCSVRRLSDSRILYAYLGTSAALSYALSRGNVF